MAVSKIAITVDEKILKKIDLMVQSHIYPNRSKAIQDAIEDKLMRLEKTRLAQECAKLDPEIEQHFAEDGFPIGKNEWPEY